MRDFTAALARVPEDALPVVITTWALSRRTVENRLRFLDHLTAGRQVAWMSVEGVGVDHRGRGPVLVTGPHAAVARRLTVKSDTARSAGLLTVSNTTSMV